MARDERLTPWADGADGACDPSMRRVFRALPNVQALDGPARQQVAARLRRPASKTIALGVLRMAAAGLVIGVAGAAGAAYGTKLWLDSRAPSIKHAAVAAPGATPARPKPRRVPAPAAPSSTAPASAASAASSVDAAASASHASKLALEAASLERALTLLRRRSRPDAESALKMLERHLREFPRGSLVLEAESARADALLLLGRRTEALALLQVLPLERMGRSSELRVIRAELLAERDCRRALSDFDALAARALSGDLHERVLYGRGACLLELGDSGGAQRAFARYLELYPQGRFAAAIRARRD